MPKLAAATAAVLSVIVIGWYIRVTWLRPDDHERVAPVVGQFMEQFGKNPEAAQRFLLANCNGQAMNLDVAAKRLGYRPAASSGLPHGYALDAVYVLKAPCCTCVESLCRSADGTVLAVFEHDNEQPMWFGSLPMVKVRCGGRHCSIVQLDGQLAASWKATTRHFTIVGLRDVEHMVKFVAKLDNDP